MSGKKFPWQPAGTIIGFLQLLLGVAHLRGDHRQPERICIWCRLS